MCVLSLESPRVFLSEKIVQACTEKTSCSGTLVVPARASIEVHLGDKECRKPKWWFLGEGSQGSCMNKVKQKVSRGTQMRTCNMEEEDKYGDRAKYVWKT